MLDFLDWPVLPFAVLVWFIVTVVGFIEAFILLVVWVLVLAHFPSAKVELEWDEYCAGPSALFSITVFGCLVFFSEQDVSAGLAGAMDWGIILALPLGLIGFVTRF